MALGVGIDDRLHDLLSTSRSQRQHVGGFDIGCRDLPACKIKPELRNHRLGLVLNLKRHKGIQSRRNDRQCHEPCRDLGSIASVQAVVGLQRPGTYVGKAAIKVDYMDSGLTGNLGCKKIEAANADPLRLRPARRPPPPTHDARWCR